MAYNLKFAAIEIRKAAFIRGIKRGLFVPLGGTVNVALVEETGGRQVTVTVENLKCARQFTWREIRELERLGVDIENC